MADKNGNTSANLGFEDKLWKAADTLRSNMDAAEYKHVVLGLIFLKYISDTFEEQHARLEAERDQGADPEDPDEYRAANTFWVPKEARWAFLLASAKQPTIGKTVDDAMLAVERDNPSLKGVLPKDYARPRLDKQRLGQLIDMIGNIGLGDKANRSKDILGRVYEYFLSQFASAEGKKGGQFYTPRCIVQLLVEMLTPYKGRVYDPCCGSGGMFVQSEKFVEAHGGRVGDIYVFGQESNHTTWKLARMNLAIRGIDGNLGPEHADSFHRDLHPDLKADYVLANPPFNDSDWRGELLRDDKRWQYGAPPAGNANFAWVQHFIHHLAPAGTGGLRAGQRLDVLQPVRRRRNPQGDHRGRPGGLHGRAARPALLLHPDPGLPVVPRAATSAPPRPAGEAAASRDRRGEILFIDARKLGTLTDRVHRELTDEDIARIADTYHAWRGDRIARGREARPYEDVPGFCKAATLDDVRGHGHVLTPGRYVGAEEVEDDGEPFEEMMARLVEDAARTAGRGSRLDADSSLANLEDVGYGRDWRSYNDGREISHLQRARSEPNDMSAVLG